MPHIDNPRSRSQSLPGQLKTLAKQVSENNRKTPAAPANLSTNGTLTVAGASHLESTLQVDGALNGAGASFSGNISGNVITASSFVGITAGAVPALDASKITTGTLSLPLSTTGAVSAGSLSATGAVSGATGSFPTSLTSLGAYSNALSSSYRVAYINSSGQFGYVSSTLASKNIKGDYSVDYQKWLALTTHWATYKSDDAQTEFATFIADDLEESFPEFVFYDDEGNLAGIRYEMLVIGLHSAFTQAAQASIVDRAQLNQTTTALQAAQASKLFQTKQATLQAIAVGVSSTSVFVNWATPFADANYLITPTVKPPAGVLAQMTAFVASRTATGCVITIQTTGVAIAAGAVLAVDGIHL